MPTPVTVARQCLTPEAAHALDEAVAVARRRGHSQTTSLHAVSALLSFPSSTLREACARARNSAYSPRLQFKALELCLSVALDRVSSAQLAHDPPVSNSLMAAVKRSQANQRRQPENYHLYHQISQQSSISCVKVELQHLILSILDDPVVSRVFAEAGFRSSEIKLAILRPFPHLLRYPRSRGHHPFFLCNLTDYPDPVRSTRPGFPFLGHDGDENSSRIGEVLGRNRGRNPLLIGVYAYDALKSFVEAVEKRKDGVLPAELAGLTVICAEKEVSKFVIDGGDRGSVDLRFGEVGQLAEQSSGPGIVVNIGDLKAFVADNASGDSVSYVVAQLTRLMELRRGKVWLIGATASYGSFLKFVGRFPAIEKDWDLQLLPITSLRAPMSESYPRSSLMESFVPFGGFFSAPSDLKLPISCSYPGVPGNLQCDEKCEQEAYGVKGGFTASVADQHQASLPSWLQIDPLGHNKRFDMKTKDDGVLLSAKDAGLQKKWDDTCHRLSNSQPLSEANFFPTIVGFQSPEDKEDHGNNINASSKQTECKNTNWCVPIDVETQSSIPLKAKNDSFSSDVWEKPSKDEDLESGGLRSSCSLPYSTIVDGCRTSPTSTTSVTTDLGLGICSSPASNSPNKPPIQNQGLKQDISGCFSSKVELFNTNLYSTGSSSCSTPDNHGQLDPSEWKMLSKALFQRVGCQVEAISVISQRIARCRATSGKCAGASQRRDVWFNFVGPDRYGKKKIAVALAEVLCRSQEQLICVDLDSPDATIHSDTVFDCQVVNGYDAKFRGKTVVDYVAGELCKKPLSIVFLENVDKADVVARNCLSQAIKTGKFSDSHGRQVGTNDAIFVTTSKSSKGCSTLIPTKRPSNYSEERILQAKGRLVQISVECSYEDGSTISQHRIASSSTIKEGMANMSNAQCLNKRKLVGVHEPIERHKVSEMPKRANKGYLDLNLTAEENAVQHTDDGSSEIDCLSDNNSKSWLQDFFGQVVETVQFKPVDFDSLAEKLFKEIKNSLHKFVSSDCLLEIDSEVMEQLLAAVHLSYRCPVVENWIEQVLSRGFAEVQKRYSSNTITTVKLKACEDLCLEQTAPKTYLPHRIIVK